jgi:hypothetical protein
MLPPPGAPMVTPRLDSRPVVSSVKSSGGKHENPKDQRQRCGERGPGSLRESAANR